ncbi:MAG: hypothetical protein FWD58_04105 [Firmicutes bacterium]|nr:hypothetical protein [Bacillota bacterium]
MQIEEVLRSMTSVMDKDPDCGFTQAHVNMVSNCLAQFVRNVQGTEGNQKKIMKCVKKVVLGLNKADKKSNTTLIKAPQRVALLAFIRERAFGAGLDSTDADITEYWSDW